MKDIVNLTPEILSVVGQLKPGAPKDYLQQKTARAITQKHLMQGLDPDGGKAKPNDAEQVRIAEPAALPKLHAQQRQAIDRFANCAMAYADREYPLLEDEGVESDFASYLTDPFFQLPAGTAVIQRTTNMATLFHIISNVLVDEKGDLYRNEPSGLVGPWKGTLLTAGNQSLATKAAVSLVTGMASAIGGAIASWIIDSLFPPGVPNYFDEVYQQMAKIVGRSLQENNITTINGAISSITNHLVSEYEPAKRQANLQNRKDRQALYALLQKYDSSFISGPNGMLGTLQNEAYEIPSFSVFCLGASLQLALFQEMCNVVPQTNSKTGDWLKPNETSYGLAQTGTVAITARKFAEYGERVWPKVIDARVKDIRAITYEHNKRVINGDVFWELWGAIEDQGEKQWARKIEKSANKDGSYPTRDQLYRDKETYVDQVKRDLKTAYSDPKQVTDGWRKLVTQPIIPAQARAA